MRVTLASLLADVRGPAGSGPASGTCRGGRRDGLPSAAARSSEAGLRRVSERRDWEAGGDDRRDRRRRTVRAIRALVRAGHEKRAARRDDDAGDRDARRRAVGARGAAEGRRRERVRLLHQSRKPQGRGAGRQPARGAVLSLEVAGPPDPHRGIGRAGRARRRPTPISRRGRATARSAPGPRRSRGRSRAARVLEARFAEFRDRYAGQERVPRPANWAGYRVRPERFEFWQERPFRLHDRVVFVREGEAWRKGRLYP